MTDHKLTPILRDVLAQVMPFASVVTHIHMKETDDGTLMVRAQAVDNTIVLESETTDPVDLDGARICMGNLMHLNQIVNSPMLKRDSELEMKTRERNGKPLISSLIFRPNNRMELVYVPTDPFRASLASPMSVTVEDWPVTFLMDADSVKELAEFKKIHQSLATGEDAIISIIYNDGTIMMEFGDAGNHNASLVLDVPVDSEHKQTYTVRVLADHLMKALNLCKSDDGVIPIRLCATAMQVVSESPVATHMLTVMGRKVRND